MSFPVVGIGASAGGLEAISELLSSLPATGGMAFLYVQHLDPEHESLLVELLAKKTPLEVQQVEDGMVVKPNHLYVIPPNTNMAVSGGILRLHSRGDPRGLHMPIDFLFHSLAEDQGPNAIGVLLSGSGSDGALGMEEIKGAGGITFAQDESSAKFSSMPRSAIRLGCVDFVLPPQDIARELVEISRHPYLSASEAGQMPGSLSANEEDLKRVFRLLRSACGVDFTHYKRSTIKRRLARRMALQKVEALADYVALLEDDPGEVTALSQDLLIRVTGFFRDPETFEGLVTSVFPRLMQDRSPQDPLRIWVPGCATGEEVYSIAIRLLEFLGDRATHTPIQIFGTDVNEWTIERCRAGVYVNNIAHEISDERLQRFFVKVDDHYQIAKSIRDMCIFAKHNVIRDPPFSRLDLVSCRNVLIYFDPVLQKRVIHWFHYALNPRGVLVLGPSETIGPFNDLFELIDKKHKIYTKRVIPGRLTVEFSGSEYTPSKPAQKGMIGTAPEPSDTERLQREADRVVLTRYAPPGIVVDEALNILQFRGQTGPYLEHQPGPTSLNLQKVARPSLLVELCTAIREARKREGPVRKERVRLEAQGEVREVNLEAIPFKASPTESRCILILFEEAPGPAPSLREDHRHTGLLSALFRKTKRRLAEGASAVEQKPEEGGRLMQLQRELDSTRDYLHTLIEEHGAAEEELKSAHEELLSSNEEYQSTNEELETAKEELQAANEELITTNDELRNRNRELDELNNELRRSRDYAEAIVETVREPLLVLDKDLRVRRANYAFYETFETTPEETENCLLFDLGEGQWNHAGLRTLLKDVLPKNTAFQDYEVTHTFPRIGQRTMLLNARRLAGEKRFTEMILLALEDITEQAAHALLKETERRKDEFLAMLAHELRNPLAAIGSAAEILGCVEAGDAKVKGVQEIIERQVKNLARIVGELLDVSRISRGTIELGKEVVDFGAAVSKAAEAAQHYFDEGRTLSLTLPASPVHIEADPLRLEQVISNLLSNAAKYTEAGGHIWVMLERRGHEAALKVRDDGIGIAPGLLSRVFDLFTQADTSLDRSRGGLGIGLTLVRHLVELHGGRVEAQSPGVGQGSEFTVHLPAISETGTRSEQEETATQPASPATSSVCRVLVVDDNEDAAQSLAVLVQTWGHEVAIAYDGPSALEVARTFRPGVVLLDIGLPGMDGYQLARHLRAMPGLEELCLIAITGYGREDDYHAAQAAGFHHHLVKPVATDKLRSLLSQAHVSGESVPA